MCIAVRDHKTEIDCSKPLKAHLDVVLQHASEAEQLYVMHPASFFIPRRGTHSEGKILNA